MKRKLTAYLLTFAMLFSLLPANVWASDDMIETPAESVIETTDSVTETPIDVIPSAEPKSSEDSAPVQPTEPVQSEEPAPIQPTEPVQPEDNSDSTLPTEPVQPEDTQPIQPTEPEQSEDPAPVQPTEPEQSEEPAPIQPTEPVQPEDNSDSTLPTEPIQPEDTQPVQPTGPEQPENPDTNPSDDLKQPDQITSNPTEQQPNDEQLNKPEDGDKQQEENKDDETIKEELKEEEQQKQEEAAKQPKPPLVEYATVDEFLTAFEEFGNVDDMDLLLALLDNIEDIYSRLSPEDQTAMLEYYLYEQAYRKDFEKDIQMMALISGERFTVKVVKVVNGNAVDEVTLTKKCLQSTGHSGYNHSTNLRDLANSSGFSGYKGYNWSQYTTVPSNYKSGPAPNNNYASVHYNITGSAPYRANETLFLFFETETIYTLKYNANGGSNAPETQAKSSINSSITFKISPQEPQRNGYTFLGWSDTSGGEATYYANGSIILQSTNPTKTLYAVWQKNDDKVTLTYDGNGNTDGNAPDSVTVSKGSQVTIVDKNSLAKDGYIFLGWSTNKDATEADWSPGDTMTLLTNTTLYAIWKENGPIVPNRTFTLEKVFKGLNEIPKDFSIDYTVTAGDNSTTGTLNLNNAASIDEDALIVTWQVPYFYNMGNSNKVVLTEHGDVEGYTYTATASNKGIVNDNVITFNVAVMASGITRTITNTYQLDAPVDDGNGISIIKTRTAVNGNSAATTATVGDTITWNITVTNESNVEKTVTLTEKLLGVTLTLGDNDITNSPQITLAAGATATVIATYVVKSSDYTQSGPLLNIVTGTTDNPKDGEKEAQDEGTEITDPYTIEKSGASKVQAGSEFIYTITVTNKTVNPVNDVTITDILPDGVTFVSYQIGDNGAIVTEKPANSSYTIDSLAAGESVTLSITVTADTIGTVKNTASLTIGDTTIDSNEVETIITEKEVTTTNLTVTKEADKQTVKPGDTVVYTITVTNSGTITAKNVIVTDQLPEGLIFSRATLDGEPIESTDNAYALGDIDAQASKQLVITATVDSNANVGTITNTATAKGDNTDESTGSEDITIPETKTTLTISKTANKETVKAGEKVVYTITVTNETVVTATGVTITDQLNSNLELISATLNDTEITPDNGVYTIGDLAGKAKAILKITAQVKANVSADTVIPNTATTNWDNPTTPETPDPESSVDITVVEDDVQQEFTLTVICLDEENGNELNRTESIYSDGDNYSVTAIAINSYDYVRPADNSDSLNGAMDSDKTVILLYKKTTAPTDPVNPTDPIDPVEPTDPVNPVDPIDPVDPVDPSYPDNSGDDNTGNDNSGNTSGGNSTGDSSSSSNIPAENNVTITEPSVPLEEMPVIDEVVPLAELPATENVIFDEEVPLAELPAEDVSIADEEIPLANVPKTGDNLPLWVLTALLSGVACFALARKRG